MLSFFPRGVLDEILNLIESVSEGFPSYFCMGKVKIIYFLETIAALGLKVARSFSNTFGRFGTKVHMKA